MFVKNLKEIGNKDVALAGGKGASLGEMVSIGLPVPPGFVVLAAAFDSFLAETGLEKLIAHQLGMIRFSDNDSVEKVSAFIRAEIGKARLPEGLAGEIRGHFRKLKQKYVAVRSSATAEDSSVASWAGELESYLNTPEKEVLANVKRCWSSLFTPRAIIYRREKKLLKKHVSVAVVVQTMIQSDASGICFTVHPVTKDRRQMIMEAAWGLGEAIVSGSVTPDSYVVEKNTWRILDVTINSQDRQLVKTGTRGSRWIAVPAKKRNRQILKNDEIIGLARLSEKLERHYKKPQDIEWAQVKGRLFIVQSRPITTL